jgi:hypothetical protein
MAKMEFLDDHTGIYQFILKTAGSQGTIGV